MSNINREIKRLAKTCANFHGENGCLLEPNGQPRCNFFREDAQALPFIESGDMRCFYFERSVLPTDPKLVRKYFGQPTTAGNRGSCDRCGKAITKRSNRQKYCDTCAKLAERDAGRELMRKVRAGC